MSLEAFLARLYVDAGLRAEFTADPVAVARCAGLSPGDCERLRRIDLEGLELAAQSFAAKRGPRTGGWLERWRERLRRATAASTTDDKVRPEVDDG